MAQTEAAKAYSKFKGSVKRYIQAMDELRKFLPEDGKGAWLCDVLQDARETTEEAMAEFEYYE